MSGLFELDGDYFALADIQRLSGLRKLSNGDRVRYLGVGSRDDQLEIHHAEAEKLLHTPIQLIPAQLGTFALQAWLVDGATQIGKTPVIAWALCLDGETRFVTPQGVNEGDCHADGDAFIEMPDGSVQGMSAYSEPCFFDHLEAYRQHEQARFEKEAAEDGAL